jgi:hypothetical protein
MSKSRSQAQIRTQCLLYYYYMTVYNDSSDRNQTIQVYIENSNQTADPTPIDIVTIADMANNNWQNHTVEINSTNDNYIVKLPHLNNYVQLFFCNSSYSVSNLTKIMEQIRLLIKQLTLRLMTSNYTMLTAHVSNN